MRLKPYQPLTKALLVSSLIWAGSAFALDVTTDTTTGLTLDAAVAIKNPIVIKASGGSIEVVGVPAITVNATAAGFKGFITVEDSITTRAAEINSDNEAIKIATGNNTDLTIDIKKGAVVQSTGKTGVIKRVGGAANYSFTLTNSGSIINTGMDANSEAISLTGNGAMPISITNTSTGLIQAGTFGNNAIDLGGIGVDVDLFNNAGVIRAPGGTAVNIPNQKVTSFTNSGTIFGKGFALNLGFNASDVNLTGGSISADVVTSNAIVTAGNINVTGGSYFGAIQGFGGAQTMTINVGAGNTFNTGGAIDNFVNFKVNSGTFNLAHNITTAGNIVVAPGANLSANRASTVFGSVSIANKTSTLSFDLTSNTVFGQITTGAGTDIGTSTVAITNKGNGYIADNTNFTVFTAAAMAVTGGEPVFSVPTSAIYRFTPVRTANNINVNVRRTSIPSIAGQSSFNDQIFGVANALEILAQTTTNTDMLNAIGELGRMANAQQVSDALVQLIPYINNNLALVIQSIISQKALMRQVRDYDVSDSSSRVSYAAGDVGSDSKVWAEILGGVSGQTNRNRFPGFNGSAAGLQLGYAKNLTDTFNMGLYTNYVDAEVKTKPGAYNKNRSKTYQFGVYALKDLGCTWLQAALSWANIYNKGTRVIQFGAINTRATNSHQSTEWDLSLGIGHHFIHDSGIHVLPSLTAAWQQIVDNGYEERGAGALNLRVNSHTYNKFDVTADVQFSTEIDTEMGTIKPKAHVGATYDISNPAEETLATFLVTGPTFKVKGQRLEKLAGNLGFGFEYAYNNALSIKANYDFNVKRYFTAHSGQMGISYKF